MALGRGKSKLQGEMWIPKREMPRVAGHPFCERLNGVFAVHSVDAFVEELCGSQCAEKIGRPSSPPAANRGGVHLGVFLRGRCER